MKKLSSIFVTLLIILNFLGMPKAVYAYTAQASAPYGVDTTVTGTPESSGDILWADTTNHSAYFTNITYDVYVPNLLDVYAIVFYDSNGNLIGKVPESCASGNITLNTDNTVATTIQPLYGQYPSGIKIELNGNPSTTGERYVYVISATNNEGNSANFPLPSPNSTPPPPSPPAPPAPVTPPAPPTIPAMVATPPVFPQPSPYQPKPSQPVEIPIPTYPKPEPIPSPGPLPNAPDINASLPPHDNPSGSDPAIPKDTPAKDPVTPRDTPTKDATIPRDTPTKDTVTPRDTPGKDPVTPRDAPMVRDPVIP